MTSEPTPVMRFTPGAMTQLRTAGQGRPQALAEPRKPISRRCCRSKHVGEPTEPTGLTALGPVEMPMPDPKHRQRADAHSLRFLDNIPGMTPAHMADGANAGLAVVREAAGIRDRQVAPLHPTQRHNKLGGPDTSSRNPARSSHRREAWPAGSLWIAETSRRVEREIPSLKAQNILNHFAKHPEHYHQCTRYQVMRSPIVLGEYVLALMEDAQGISREGTREIARDINRAAGARILDSLDHESIRTLTSKSVDQLMHQPKYVPDRTKLRGRKNLQVLSLGAGLQSTVMALMAEHGHEGLEKPDFAIFADTGWEPPAVYENLEWLEEQLSYDVIRVENGNLRENILSGTNTRGNKFIDIPVFIINPDGTSGVATRQCTEQHKIIPIHRYLREYLGLKHGKRAQTDIQVDMWLGITIDEAARRKPSKNAWITNIYPLIDRHEPNDRGRNLSRLQLHQWFQEHYPERHLPKSACIGCPYHTDALWAEMKKNDPESFQDAVNVDWALRNVPASRGSLKGTAYLHKSLTPLSDVDLSQAVPESEAMQQECEGTLRDLNTEETTPMPYEILAEYTEQGRAERKLPAPSWVLDGPTAPAVKELAPDGQLYRHQSLALERLGEKPEPRNQHRNRLGEVPDIPGRNPGPAPQRQPSHGHRPIPPESPLKGPDAPLAADGTGNRSRPGRRTENRRRRVNERESRTPG